MNSVSSVFKSFFLITDFCRGSKSLVLYMIEVRIQTNLNRFVAIEEQKKAIRNEMFLLLLELIKNVLSCKEEITN